MIVCIHGKTVEVKEEDRRSYLEKRIPQLERQLEELRNEYYQMAPPPTGDYAISIRDIGLKVMTANSLYRGGIQNLGDLRDFLTLRTVDDLFALKWFGEGAKRDLLEVLERRKQIDELVEAALSEDVEQWDL